MNYTISIFMRLPSFEIIDAAERLNWFKTEVMDVALKTNEDLLASIQANGALDDRTGFVATVRQESAVLSYALETVSLIEVEPALYLLSLAVEPKHIEKGIDDHDQTFVANQMVDLLISKLRACAHIRVHMDGATYHADESIHELLEQIAGELDVDERNENCLEVQDLNHYQYRADKVMTAEERIAEFLAKQN